MPFDTRNPGALSATGAGNVELSRADCLHPYSILPAMGRLYVVERGGFVRPASRAERLAARIGEGRR